ncbi:MAG: M23 family metallopeptidase [Treponema sp.]|jgi:LysM repeat protein|nr:M23 family metallopeptidase [Treponema sp.]
MVYQRGINSLFLLTAVSVLGLLASRLCAEDVVHVVVKGETVYSISRSYRVSPDELMRHNNITDASKLQIGKRLRIPASGVVTSASSGGSTTTAGAAQPGGLVRNSGTEYRVVPKDTLYSIARTYGVTLQALRDINGFSKDHVLKAGELIKIPAPAPLNDTRTARSGPPQTAPKTAASPLRWPVTPAQITYMEGKLTGVFLLAERSEPVRSLTEGKVVAAGPYRGFGNVVIVETGSYLYVYGSCENLSVTEGDRIGPGTELGKLGIYAATGKPQLVFMVYQNYSPIDPAKAPRA